MTHRIERKGVSGLQNTAQQKVVNYRKPSVGRTLVQNRTLIFMCLPAILFFFVFSYLPMPGAYIAFTNFQYNKGIFASPFVGLKNFQFLFSSGQLGLLLKNTVLYNLAFIILGNILQLAFAIMLNEVASKGYKKTAQSIMFLPYFISDVLVSLLVYNLINYDFGFISHLVRNLGGEMPKVYQNAGAWPFIIVLVHLWKSTGYGTVVYFAAITGMDSSMMEAAQIDGANAWQRIRYITLPTLKPTVIILFLFAIGGLMNLSGNCHRPDMVQKGATILKVLAWTYILYLLVLILTRVFRENVFNKTLAITFSVLVILLSIVQYILYLSYLAQAKRMLREN
jgi:putative aldouronate transport system permease protein